MLLKPQFVRSEFACLNRNEFSNRKDTGESMNETLTLTANRLYKNRIGNTTNITHATNRTAIEI